VYDRLVGSRTALVACLAAAGCSQVLGIDDLHGPDGGQVGPDVPDGTGPAANCTAQRAVYLIGGSGGLAWFTLEWPLPDVITKFSPTFAYDDPAQAVAVVTDPMHPLFARHALWQNNGTTPFPTAFVGGQNETHTNSPGSFLTAAGQTSGMAAAGAAMQQALQPMVAVLMFAPGAPYGSANGAPPPTSINNAAGAVSLFPASLQSQLQVSQAQLSRYLPGPATQAETDLAENLAFTANALRLGLIGTVMMPAFDDDPHTAFDSKTAGARADNLAHMLDAFYGDLATANEATCGSNHDLLPVSANTVMVVVGDTPKDSFMGSAWQDATAGNANFLYVRSNGFIKPGWFGQIDAEGGRLEFDPQTGAIVPDIGQNQPDTDAAFASVLYAIARGDQSQVRQFTQSSFAGEIAR
jgi:hypothetical protein